jgi:hypothetical protein
MTTLIGRKRSTDEIIGGIAIAMCSEGRVEQMHGEIGVRKYLAADDDCQNLPLSCTCFTLSTTRYTIPSAQSLSSFSTAQSLLLLQKSYRCAPYSPIYSTLVFRTLTFLHYKICLFLQSVLHRKRCSP